MLKFIYIFRNHILESLPYIGSTASVEMMAQEIVKKSVNKEIAQKWLTSLSFLPRYNFQWNFKLKHDDHLKFIYFAHR